MESSNCIVHDEILTWKVWSGRERGDTCEKSYSHEQKLVLLWFSTILNCPVLYHIYLEKKNSSKEVQLVSMVLQVCII